MVGGPPQLCVCFVLPMDAMECRCLLVFYCPPSNGFPSRPGDFLHPPPMEHSRSLASHRHHAWYAVIIIVWPSFGGGGGQKFGRPLRFAPDVSLFTVVFFKIEVHLLASIPWSFQKKPPT